MARLAIVNIQTTTYIKIKGIVRGDMPTEYYGFRDVHTAVRYFIDDCEKKCSDIMRTFHQKNPPPNIRP